MLRGKQTAALETAGEKLGWGLCGMLRGCGAPWEVLRSPLMLLSSKGVKGCPGRGGRGGWEAGPVEAGAAAWVGGGRGREGAWMSGAGPSRSPGWTLVATHRGQGSLV